jgi:hypothetical protein
MRKLFFVIFFFAVLVSAQSQIAVGAWRDHFSFSNIVSITEDNENTIIAASTNGIVYKYNDGSFSKLSKANGLSDVGISVIKYFQDIQVLLVCYENGNIDIVSNDKVVNISDIKRKNIAGDKKIYAITKNGTSAYLSTGFGIVNIDIQNAQIIDTYYIGDNASLIPVYNCCIVEDTILAATDNGIYKASLNDYLSDYNSWQLVENQQFTVVKDVANLNGKIYIVAKNLSDEYMLFYKQSSGDWVQIGEALREDS